MTTANEYMSGVLNKAETNAKQYGFETGSPEMTAFLLGYIITELQSLAFFFADYNPASFTTYNSKRK